MVISDKHREANRQNAQHSTGPKTPEGKAAIRFNALTYGLRIRSTILEDENAADYSQLWNELEADWLPQTRTERCYLETLVTSQWLLKRVAESERRIYDGMALGEKQLVMLVLEDETAADYSQLWNEWEADWLPQTRTERCYLETLVTSQWLLKRV